MTEPEPTPTDDERRRAACMAMGAAPGLIRFATRFTRSLHDAEDAYQRAMEIALTRAPVVEPARYMAWLHTVLRNEALAVARSRRREGPGAEADVAEAYGERIHEAVSIDALAEWRDRYRSIQDGLAGLTDAQRICLMLQSAGASYERIREITGFSLRKVERSVLEGRRGLMAWELKLATGEACVRLDGPIARVAAGEATPKERRAVARHVRHCGPCRATLRNRRDSNEWLGALVPVALIGGQAMLGAPDPSPGIAWWERVAAGATVRAGHAVQMAMEMPSAALAKVGAGSAALAVVGAAGAPLVADGLGPSDAGPPAVVASRPAAVSATGESGGGNPTGTASFARARRATTEAAERARPRRSSLRARPAETVVPAPRARRSSGQAVSAAVSAPVAPAPAAAPASAPAPAPAPPSASAVALEFGP